MKKLLIWILVLSLALGLLSVTAFAEGQTGSSPDAPIVMDYHNIDTTVYDGSWTATGLGFDVYLPSDWILVDITDELAAAGLAFQAGENGGGANLTVTKVALPEEVKDSYGYEQLGQELAATNTTAAYANLNGIQSVIFENEDTKVSGFCVLPGDGSLISGVISAHSDDEYDAFVPSIQNMIMSVSPSEGTGVPELKWENYEADVLEMDPDGRFVTFDEANVKIWVTSLLKQEELTEEDMEEGFIGYFEDENQEVGLSIAYWDYEGITVEEYEALILENENCTKPDRCIINGMNALTYSDLEGDAINVDIVTDAGYVLSFYYWPLSDTGYYSLAQLMTASIQAK